MNNHQMARAMLRRAEAILDEARYLYQKGYWNLVVRRCQEGVELALKAALLWAGAEVPRLHDVGPILQREKHRFPGWFQTHIPRLASVSRRLRLEREISFYGDEQSGIPAEELYGELDARSALEEAQRVLETCGRLFAERSP